MEFTSATMLRALPVAAIPVIIYLLFRWRRREIEWGSMYVLRRVLETKSRLRAWMQYLVVALRTLALAAVVVAVAGPAGQKVPVGTDAFPSPPPSTHRVVLLDTSASMAARHEASTRLEAALGLCRTMLRSGISPGRVDIVPLAGGHEPIIFDTFPVNATRIEEAGVSFCFSKSNMNLSKSSIVTLPFAPLGASPAKSAACNPNSSIRAFILGDR